MPKASPLFHYQHISFDLIEVIELSLFASSCMSMASLFFIIYISFCWHSVCLLLSYRSAMPSGLLHWAFAFRSIQLLMHTWSVCFFGPRPLFCQSPRWRYSFGWHSACLPYSYCYARPPSGLLHWAFACCYQFLSVLIRGSYLVQLRVTCEHSGVLAFGPPVRCTSGVEAVSCPPSGGGRHDASNPQEL